MNFPGAHLRYIVHTIFPRRFLFFRYRWEGFVTVVSASQPSSMPIVNFFELHKLCHQQLQICILSWVQRQLFFFASQLLIVKTFEDGGDGDSLKVNKNV